VPNSEIEIVSRLQQATKIALAYKCVPEIAIISSMMIPPARSPKLSQGPFSMNA